VVNVSAKDKATGKEHSVKIQSSGGLSDEEVEKMVKDAEANSEADKEKKELIEAKNNADSLVYSTEKSLEDHKDKIDDATKSDIEAKIKELKDLIAKEDAKAEEIKSKTDELTQSSMKLGEAIYKEQQEAAGAQPSGSDSGEEAKTANDDVVDAEYEEVKEDEDNKANGS